MAKSVCIVASTLPIALLATRAQSLGVEKIVTTSQNLTRSYAYLADRVDGAFEVRAAPSGLVKQSLYFALLLIRCRFLGRRLVIFHECCMPVLDLLILIIRPRGDYFPQVSMLGSIPQDMSMAPRSTLLSLLRFSGLSRLFKLYYSPPVGSNKGEYSLSIKSYPSTIVSHPIGYAGGASTTDSSGTKPLSRAVLLLTGKALAKDEEQIALFRSIVDVAVRNGFRCDVKDHPNPYFRLGFSDGKVTQLDPVMPSELLTDDYALVIGASSTSLLGYGKRAFSIIEMLQSLTPEEIALAKAHFIQTAPDCALRYIANLRQLETIFEELEP